MNRDYSFVVRYRYRVPSTCAVSQPRELSVEASLPKLKSIGDSRRDQQRVKEIRRWENSNMIEETH